MYEYTDEYLESYEVIEVEDCGFGHYLQHFEEFCDGLVFELPTDKEPLLANEASWQ